MILELLQYRESPTKYLKIPVKKSGNATTKPLKKPL